MKHRKLFPGSDSTNETIDCLYYCDRNCAIIYNCVPLPDINFYSPPPPPPPAPPHHSSHSISPSVIIFVTLGLSFFLCLAYYVVVYKTGGVCNSENNNGHRPRQAQSDDDEGQEFVDENRIDHPIWLIHTVGLQQSVINSIAICKYKKGEGLIEGTECSVCLNEFRDDETVRLLPKCNHAFHISCIDTWLSSHVNCPMCRARIVPGSVTAAPTMATIVNQNSDSLSSLAMDNYSIELSSGIDRELGENRESIIREDCEDRMEPEADRIVVKGDDIQTLELVQSIRRSVSLDSSLAETICIGLADFVPVEFGEFPCDQTKEDENFNCNNSAIVVVKQDGGYSNSSMCGDSSIVQSLHKSPVSMKRSFSCSGRFLSSRRYSRNLNAILPLL